MLVPFEISEESAEPRLVRIDFLLFFKIKKKGNFLIRMRCKVTKNNTSSLSFQIYKPTLLLKNIHIFEQISYGNRIKKILARYSSKHLTTFFDLNLFIAKNNT